VGPDTVYPGHKMGRGEQGSRRRKERWERRHRTDGQTARQIYRIQVFFLRRLLRRNYCMVKGTVARDKILFSLLEPICDTVFGTRTIFNVCEYSPRPMNICVD
jgi:hypothetical protein